MKPLLDRFLGMISPEPMSGCWLWKGAPTGYEGYGQIFCNGRQVKAHRVAYELFRGQIPAGLHLDHLCRIPWCVNPDHLEPVTCRENILRGISIQAQNAKKTRCIRGHEF